MAIVPQTLDETYRLAKAVVMAGVAPKTLNTPEKAMVAIMHGMEVGFTPMMALQSIAVINGVPSIWGDGAIALVRGSPLCESIKEELSADKQTATCTVKRQGEDPISRSFTVDEAKKARLWGKQGPWTDYPPRMLQMRARSFALRDAFPDVLRGLRVADELQDYRDVTPAENKGLTERLSANPDKPTEGFNVVTGEIIEIEVESALEPSPEAEEPHYLIGWTDLAHAHLANLQTKADVKAFWAQPDVVKRMEELKTVDVERAKALHAEVNKRIKALPDA